MLPPRTATTMRAMRMTSAGILADSSGGLVGSGFFFAIWDTGAAKGFSFQ